MTHRMAVMHTISRGLARWCRAHAPETAMLDVPGLDERARRRLVALGVAAGALSEDVRDAPPEVAAWLRHPDVDPPDELLSQEVVDALREGIDVLGQAYVLLTSRPQRRVLGTFFTPRPVVDHMVALAAELAPQPRHVVDPGAGVGAFTTAIRSQWPAATVHAVDVNPVTLGALAVEQAVKTGKLGSELALHHADYLSWLPISGKDLRGPVLTLGNPPYTRYHELTSGARQIVAKAPGNGLLEGSPSLAAVILAAAFETMRPEDSACLLLPTHWAHGRYARRLRQALWQTNREIRLQTFPAGERFFDDANVAACILAIGPVTSDAQFVHQQVQRARDFLVSVGTAVQITRCGPCPPAFPPLQVTSTSAIPTCPVHARITVPLAHLARTRRGVATGANALFFIDSATAAHLPPNARRPAILRLGHVKGHVLDAAEHQRLEDQGRPCWLVDVPPELDEDPGVLEWRQLLLKHGVNRRYIPRQRSPRWWSVEPVKPPQLILAPMAKGALRVLRNDAAVVPSNSANGLYLRGGVALLPFGGPTDQVGKLSDEEYVDLLGRWLRGPDGQDQLRNRARAHSGDLHKVELRALATVEVPVRLLADVPSCRCPVPTLDEV